MGLKEAGLRGSLRNVSTGVAAIPDSVVSRPADDSTTVDRDEEFGLQIETKSDWPSIGCRISNDTSGATRAYLREEDGTVIDSQDISGLSAGDAITFEDVGLVSGNIYRITVDAEGDTYTVGFYSNPTYPYTSNDVDILARYRDEDISQETAVTINDIGNTGFD